jgi:adenine-specific DNA methylase
MDRRLIEVSFPIREVSEESSREKNIRHGHISTLHIWWARRPLAASRATIYAALVKPKDIERQKEFIASLAKWESSLNLNIIEQARKDILEAYEGNIPKVLDPFAGGGSIPLEALRLGCETYAGDYNPVATLILKCVLEYPQKYGNSNNNNQLNLNMQVQARNQLLEDVKKWGKWVLEEARKEIARFYPVDDDGSIPIGYIWARTIPCQNPLCQAEIPLMRQFWLANNKRKISLYPYVSDKKVNFKIVGTGYEEDIPKGFDPKKGTVSKAVAKCLVCGYTVDDKTTRRLFANGKSGQRMIAVVLHNPKTGKTYRIATDKDLQIFKEAEKYLEEKREKLREEWGIDPVPNEDAPGTFSSSGGVGPRYCFYQYGDYYNSRQKLALITFTEKVKLAYKKMVEEGYDEEYSVAVMSYLGLIVSRITDFNNTGVRWGLTRELFTNLFARQALPMTWDYIEINPNSEIVNIPDSMFMQNLRVLNFVSRLQTKSAVTSQFSATALPYPDNYFDAVITDPPYYDNVAYSYLSDFFYVWLKRILGDIYPDLFITPLTPKSEEIVAYSDRGGKRYFEEMLKKALKEIHRVLKPNGIAVIVYAHKSVAGWEVLINSLLDSGLTVTASWPIHTEMKNRLIAQESAALASSIYIVARKIQKIPIGFYKDVKDELSKYLNSKLEQLWDEGIAGADFFISAIGSAIEVFGKYEKVIDSEGNQIDTIRLLNDVRKLVTDYTVRQILHDGFAAEITPLTRFYILWRWAYGNNEVEFDEARKLGQSIGLDITQEWNRRGSFISKRKEFIKVLGPKERQEEHLKDSRELIDVLHRVLLLWEKGKNDEIINILTNTGYGKSDVFYRVAQTISESIPNNDEKRLLDGFLAGKDRIMRQIENNISVNTTLDPHINENVSRVKESKDMSNSKSNRREGRKRIKDDPKQRRLLE